MRFILCFAVVSFTTVQPSVSGLSRSDLAALASLSCLSSTSIALVFSSESFFPSFLLHSFCALHVLSSLFLLRTSISTSIPVISTQMFIMNATYWPTCSLTTVHGIYTSRIIVNINLNYSTSHIQIEYHCNIKHKIYNFTSPSGSNILATVCPMFLRYWA